MLGSDILEMIWDGRVRPAQAVELSHVATCVDRLLPVNVVFLVCSDSRLGGVSILKDTDCLAPELTLGDVLAEECELSLPGNSLVAILPSAQLVGAMATGRAPELAGQIAAKASSVVEQYGMQHSGRACTFFALWHCYDTLLDLGFSETLGVDLIGFMAGFKNEAQRTWGLSGRIISLSNGSSLPDAQAIQNGAVLKSMILCGLKFPLDVFSEISSLPSAWEWMRPTPRGEIKVGGV